MTKSGSKEATKKSYILKAYKQTKKRDVSFKRHIPFL